MSSISALGLLAIIPGVPVALMAHLLSRKVRIPRFRIPAPPEVEGELPVQRRRNLSTLEKALEVVVKDHGGDFADAYESSEGVWVQVPVAVRTNDFPWGIGVDLDDSGELRFRYDEGREQALVAKKICDEVKQHYVVLAMISLQEDRGFRVSVAREPLPQGGCRVRLVATKGGQEGQNRWAVEPTGGMEVEFFGYQGTACHAEEDSLASALKGVGLATRRISRREKTLGQTQEEVRSLLSAKPDEQAGHRRRMRV